ncbi:MAG TPA: hypothetical protein VHT51_15885 [Micropepsaceae bacterium]|jgi:hypothetical protein|nr:hypothetical protein [Micropepsaceae bacterium]
MNEGDRKRQRCGRVLGAVLAGSALLFPLAAVAATPATPAHVTLRCAMNREGSGETIVQYYVVDPAEKTISLAGEMYRIGTDPSGKSGKVITRWSDTEIMLVNEEWIREGWQRFRIVTVLDRLSGAIRSEGLDTSYTGNCAIADTSKRLF